VGNEAQISLLVSKVPVYKQDVDSVVHPVPKRVTILHSATTVPVVFIVLPL